MMRPPTTSKEKAMRGVSLLLPLGLSLACAAGIAVADGYWLMLTPLSLGEQLDIRFGGGVSAVGISFNAISRITAVPEPSTITLSGFGAVAVVGSWICRRKRMIG